MRPRLIRSRQTRAWVLWLLLPALASRLLVPAGFMPGTGADNAPTMQMCHGAGPLPLGSSAPVGDEDGAPAGPAHHTAPCVFAAAGMAAPPPIVPPVLDVAIASEFFAPEVPQAPANRPQHRAQSPRAPPAGIRSA